MSSPYKRNGLNYSNSGGPQYSEGETSWPRGNRIARGGAQGHGRAAEAAAKAAAMAVGIGEVGQNENPLDSEQKENAAENLRKLQIFAKVYRENFCF